MKCLVLHESQGRLRVHLCINRMSLHSADILEYYLRGVAGVTGVAVYDRTCDAVVAYNGSRSDIIKAFAAFSFGKAEAVVALPEQTGRSLNREFEDKLVFTFIRRFFSKLFLPLPLRSAIAVYHSLHYIKTGLRAFLEGRLSVSVLDATAVTVSLLRRDFDTASSVMFMLRLGELLEEWTHKKSVSDLAGAMPLNVEKVWLKTDEQEILVSINDISEGDKIIVRTGNLIPLDGKVVSGDAMVNQASMTGESLPVK